MGTEKSNANAGFVTEYHESESYATTVGNGGQAMLTEVSVLWSPAYILEYPKYQ